MYQPFAVRTAAQTNGFGLRANMEELFSKVLKVTVRCKECEERKANIHVTIELQMSTNPVHKRDLLVRLTDDTDPYFLFNLSISEEDFQSLKVQQGLLIDFASFPQKFIDLLNQCFSEQESDSPRFLLHLSCQSAVLEGPASFSVVETNAFKHLNHLSLRLVQGSDKHLKDYLALCLASLKAEKQALEMKLKKTEDDMSRQLSYAQQTLSEKTKELDKVRSEWTSQSSSLSSRYSLELQSERDKANELQSRLQQQSEQLRQELESAHVKSSQQLQSRLTELEASCRELSERKYKNESTIRDLKIKLSAAEEDCQRLKQQVLSLRRENGSLDTEVHEKERQASQLQMRVAVLEQELKDKEQLMCRTKEVLEATQQQKESVEGNAENKELQIKKLEATVKLLSEDLIKANGIIKKLMGEVRGLVAKIQVKNTVTVSQEKVLQETSEKLENVRKDLQSAQQQLITKDEQVSKLKEQLETTVQKLNESREVLKTNENVISWLNKQLNEKQLSRKTGVGEGLENPSLPSTAGLRAQFYPQTVKAAVSSVDVSPAELGVVQPPNKPSGDSAGLDSKYFERRDDSIPIFGLSPDFLHRDFPQRPKANVASAYFTASKCVSSGLTQPSL